METVVVLIANPDLRPLAGADLDRVARALEAAGGAPSQARWLAPGEAAEMTTTVAPEWALQKVQGALDHAPIDCAVVPAANRLKRLFLADMDSTMITVECIDELAEFAGRKNEVAALTHKAMTGELGFEEALRARVRWLKGLPRGGLDKVYQERVRTSPGAPDLVRTLKAHGVRTVLVSGGFTYFTERVAEVLGFDAHHGNTLEFDGAGVLTGRVHEPILGRDAKLQTLIKERDQLGLDRAQTMAVGDGANDLAMIAEAGLGIAYRAKRALADKADVRIQHGDLTALLFVQGIAREAFAD